MSDARVRLRRQVTKLGGTKVAQELGCSRAYLYMLMKDRLPGRDLAQRMQDQLRIPMTAWSNWKWLSGLKGNAA